MPELSQLTRPKPTEAVADFGDGDVVKVVFDRNKITPAWMKDAQARDEEMDVEALPKALLDVIISWDVLNGGQVTEPSLEILCSFSYPVQSGLLTAIMQAAMPSSEEGNVSMSTSAIPGEVSSSAPVNPQNGPLPSPSPAPLASQSPT